MFVFFASRRRNTRCALVTGVQTVCSSDLLAAACSELPQLAKKIADDALFGVTGGSPTHDRIDGRFGAAHADQIRSAPPEERTALGDTPYSLAELRWSLAHEAVVHLDDLLLRQIGRASCRERVCQYVSISVVAGSLQKKQTKSKAPT